jgi:hypothetical protein
MPRPVRRLSAVAAARCRSARGVLGAAYTTIGQPVLGETYESLARSGETMTTAAIVTYAYDQIDQTRTDLNAVQEWTTYERHESRFRAGTGCTAISQTPVASGDTIPMWTATPILAVN